MQQLAKYDTMTLDNRLDTHGLPVGDQTKIALDRRKVRWAKGKDFQSWTTVQVVSTDIWMDDLVQRNQVKLTALENETNDLLHTVNFVVGRQDGNTSADALRDSVDRLKALYDAGRRFHKALDSDILTARQHSLKTVTALNKLVPRLVKTTNSISRKTHEAQALLQKQSY